MLDLIKKNKFLFYRFPAIIWALIILILCSTPGNKIPSISWLELISFDKFVHASIFFILNLLSIRSVQYKSFKTAIVFTSICILYGGMLEIAQSYLFYKRSGDILDFIANSFGCIMAVLFFEKIKRRLPLLF